MTIALIAAHDPNLVIGKDGKLPWHYPGDLEFFKNTTMGYPIVMGRKTFEEFGAKPLPGRKNVVLSRSKDFEQVSTYASLQRALKALKKMGYEKIFIAGGEHVYRQSIDRADRLIITEIHKEYEGDTYFPEYRDQVNTVWEPVQREKHEEYTFITYRRKSQ